MQFEDQGIDGRIILNLILKNSDGMMCLVFRTGTRGDLL
jgi:hypothetical protein